MRRQEPLRAVTPRMLGNILWAAFLIWSVLVGVLWMSGVSGAAAAGAFPKGPLRVVANLLIGSADALWLVLTAVTVYLGVASREGLNFIRVRTLWIAVAAVLLAVCSLRTGAPLGTGAYTERLGMKIVGVPFGWALLWITIVLSARETALRFLPRASHLQIAFASGLLALLTILNLEPLASQVRFFWFWYVPGTRLPSSAGAWNYLTWTLAVTSLAFAIRSPHPAYRAQQESDRASWTLGILNLVFLLTHLSGPIRN